jgi:hypothetical protein
MHRFKNILLTGLVALLMVGMVNAGDQADEGLASSTTAPGDAIYLGFRAPDGSCQPYGEQCLKIAISFDIIWLINLFR